MMRIYVDFNTMMVDPEERVSINTRQEPELLSHLYPGLRVLIADGDEAGCLEVEAVLEFDQQHERWFARPDWATRRDLPNAGATRQSGGD